MVFYHNYWIHLLTWSHLWQMERCLMVEISRVWRRGREGNIHLKIPPFQEHLSLYQWFRGISRQIKNIFSKQQQGCDWLLILKCDFGWFFLPVPIPTRLYILIQPTNLIKEAGNISIYLCSIMFHSTTLAHHCCRDKFMFPNHLDQVLTMHLWITDYVPLWENLFYYTFLFHFIIWDYNATLNSAKSL